MTDEQVYSEMRPQRLAELISDGVPGTRDFLRRQSPIFKYKVCHALCLLWGRKGFVYFAQSRLYSCALKIGFSKNPARRLIQVAHEYPTITGRLVPRLLHVAPAFQTDESAFHRRFANSRVRRFAGNPREWYWFGSDLVKYLQGQTGETFETELPIPAELHARNLRGELA